jgi:hypothetical protein
MQLVGLTIRLHDPVRTAAPGSMLPVLSIGFHDVLDSRTYMRNSNKY